MGRESRHAVSNFLLCYLTTVNRYDDTGSGDEFTRRNIYPIASLHTTNSIRPGLGLKSSPLGDGRQLVVPATARPATATFA
jgi:hypothetical protein